MASEEFEAARISLRLTVWELSAILDTSSVTIWRWEVAADKKTERDTIPTAYHVLRWLADGRSKREAVLQTELEHSDCEVNG